jgi:protein ImuB
MSRTIAVVFPQWEKDHGRFGEHHSFRSFEPIVRRITEICAVVEVVEAGTAVMTAKGPSRYFGGDANVAHALNDACRNNEDVVGVGIADSRFAAIAAARLAASRKSPCVISSSITTEFIDAMPVRALSEIGNIDVGMVDLLMRLGLGRCGDVRHLGEAALIDRFGLTGHHVFQLVSAQEIHGFSLDTPPSDFSCVYESDTPLVSVPHVVGASHCTIEEMMRRIDASGQQCVRVLVHCETDHGESMSRIWGESRGFTVSALAQRLSYQLDGWLVHAGDDVDAPTSGIVRVCITPLECREALATQAVLWGGNEENTERAARAVAQMCAVADCVHVTVPQWEGGRDITTAYSQVSAGTVDITQSQHSAARVGAAKNHTEKWSGSLPMPWPAWVAAQPIDINVLDAHQRHVGVTGRHELTSEPVSVEMGALRYHVEKVGGPWPVEERWWDPRRARRHVRAQLLVRNAQGAQRIFLVVLENNVWKLIARYD